MANEALNSYVKVYSNTPGGFCQHCSFSIFANKRFYAILNHKFSELT